MNHITLEVYKELYDLYEEMEEGLLPVEFDEAEFICDKDCALEAIAIFLEVVRNKAGIEKE